MLLKKTNLIAVMSCVMMLAAAPLLPTSFAYAKDGGSHGGGSGGGNGAGHGGGIGNGGRAEGHSADAGNKGRSEGQESDHDGRAVRDRGLSGLKEGQESDHTGRAVRNHGLSGLKEGQESDHAGRAVRDHGIKGHHTGLARNAHKGHGLATSGIAHAKTTHGLTKATAISATTPGDHNTKGLSKAVTSSTKLDR